MGHLRAVLFLLLVSLSPAESQTEATPREILSVINERDRQYGQRFDAQEKAVAAALAAAKEAVVKAEAASDKRFESVNEFRKTLTDQTGTFIPRTEAEVKFKSLEEKVAEVRTFQVQALGRSEGINWLWGLLVGGGGLLVTALGFSVAAYRRSAPPGV